MYLPYKSKRLKAYLVFRGFKERFANKRINSLTYSRQALGLTIVTSSIKHWDLSSMGISSAFLQGNEIKRMVYVNPPPEFQEEKL